MDCFLRKFWYVSYIFCGLDLCSTLRADLVMISVRYWYGADLSFSAIFFNKSSVYFLSFEIFFE